MLLAKLGGHPPAPHNILYQVSQRLATRSETGYQVSYQVSQLSFILFSNYGQPVKPGCQAMNMVVTCGSFHKRVSNWLHNVVAKILY